MHIWNKSISILTVAVIANIGFLAKATFLSNTKGSVTQWREICKRYFGRISLVRRFFCEKPFKVIAS